MDGYWKGYGSVGKYQEPISIPNECFKFLDSVVIMIDKRNIYPEMKQPQLHKIQSSKQLKTLSQKTKQVVLRLQKLFKESNKQTNDPSSLVKQKEDSLLAFLNQCMAARKETKYINQRASQICYSQNNRKQLISLIDLITKNQEIAKQIQDSIVKSGDKSYTAWIKDVLQENKKAKQIQKQNNELKDTIYSYQYLIWQLVNYNQNQSQIEVFTKRNSNNKNFVQRQRQIQVKIFEMRMFMRLLDQKLKSYRDQKAKQLEERLGKPIDRLLHQLENRQPIHNQINRILMNLHTNKHESFQADTKDCDKSTQQILRKIKTEFDTSAANARKICDKINDKIKFHFNKKVVVQNISKVNNTSAILGQIDKSLSDYETIIQIYVNFVNQINNLQFIHESSQTKLQQRLKAYINDLQQIEKKFKMYAQQNIFPFKNEASKSKDQNQMKMISNQQADQNKKLIAQIEKHKSMIRTIQKENEENIQKIQNYIKQILQKTQSITQQKLQNLQYYNLQKAKLQKLEQQYQKRQKVINSLQINQQQLLENVKSLTEQLQRVKEQFEQKQKYYQSTILSSKQAEARMANQKTALLQGSRFLKTQISELNESCKQEKEQFRKDLEKGFICFVDHTNQKNSLLLGKIGILQKRIDSIVSFFEILKDKRQKTKLQIQILKQTVKQLNKTKEQALTAFQKQKQQRQKLSEYISTLHQLFQDQKLTLKLKQQQIDNQFKEIHNLNNKILKINTDNQVCLQNKQIEIQYRNQSIITLKTQMQRINSDNKNFIQNQQEEIENKKQQISKLQYQIKVIIAEKECIFSIMQLQSQNQGRQITDLKDQIKIINDEKQLCIQNSKLKIDDIQKQVDDLKNQIKQITENKICTSVKQFNNENKEKQIIDLQRQISLTTANEYHCIQTNLLKIVKLQEHIIILKDRIQSMQEKIDELTVNLSEKQLFIDVLNNKIYQITQQNLATTTMIKTKPSFNQIVNQYQDEISWLKGQLLCQQSKFNRAYHHINNILVWLNQIMLNSSILQSSHKATDDLKMIQDSTIMIEGKVQKSQKNISEQSNLLSKNHIIKYFTEIKQQISKLQNSLKPLLSLKETIKLLHTIGIKLQTSIHQNDRDSQLMLMDSSIIDKKTFEANEEIIISTRCQFVQIE